MSRRRRALTPREDRDDLAARLRERHEGRAGWSHWGRLVARLEAGEAVVVPGWLVRAGVGHVRIEEDGSMTAVEPVRNGTQIVKWVPVSA